MAYALLIPVVIGLVLVGFDTTDVVRSTFAQVLHQHLAACLQLEPSGGRTLLLELK